MAPFQAVRDDGKPYWRVAYELFRGRPYGDLVTYDQLADALGIDIRTNRHPVYRADQELRDSDQRALVAVPRQGYRVLHPTENEAVAQGQRRKSHRAMRKSVSIALATNLEMVDPEQAKRLDGFVRWGQAITQSLDYSHRRHDRTEQAIADLKDRMRRVEQSG